MSWVLAAVGVALLTIAAVDVLVTTLGQGGGPLFLRITSLGWWIGSRLHRWRSGHRVLAVFGIAGFLLTVALWLMLSWVGWSLILAADPGAVVVSDSGEPASFVDRLHYVGFIMVTLTRGDFEPEGHWVKFASLAATTGGFFLISLSITFLITAVQAATHRRNVALYVYSLGSSACGIVLRGWDGERCACLSLAPHLQALTAMMTQLVQNHVTFPAVRFFHSLQRSSAAAPSLAALDEALTIIEYGLPDAGGLDTATIRTLRRSIDAYLLTLRGVHIRPASAAPPIPTLRILEARGVPVLGEDRFAEAVGQLDERRRLLRAMVEADGWSWRDVLAEPEEEQEERHPDRESAEEE